MKLSDLRLESLDLIQGMEKQLRERRRGAAGSLVFAVVAFFLQFLLALGDSDYAKKLKEVGELAKKIGTFDFSRFLTAAAWTPELVGALLVLIGVLGYIALRWTSLLMRDTEECFRYTF